MYNAFWFAVPIILIRYVYLRYLSFDAFKRAAYFPPVKGVEKIALKFYQISTILLFISLFFLNISFSNLHNKMGIILYLIGLIYYTISIYDYARPQDDGLNNKGVYSFSRNPMYVAFFVYFLGIGLITGSILYIILLILFQISVHYIIISEERACLIEFEAEYKKYMEKVNRYIGKNKG